MLYTRYIRMAHETVIFLYLFLSDLNTAAFPAFFYENSCRYIVL